MSVKVQPHTFHSKMLEQTWFISFNQISFNNTPGVQTDEYPVTKLINRNFRLTVTSNDGSIATNMTKRYDIKDPTVTVDNPTYPPLGKLTSFYIPSNVYTLITTMFVNTFTKLLYKKMSAFQVVIKYRSDTLEEVLITILPSYFTQPISWLTEDNNDQVYNKKSNRNVPLCSDTRRRWKRTRIDPNQIPGNLWGT